MDWGSRSDEKLKIDVIDRSARAAQYLWQDLPPEPPFNATRFAGVTKTAAQCCDLCKGHAGWPPCNAWGWCAAKTGCLPPVYGSGGPTDKHGQVCAHCPSYERLCCPLSYLI